MIGTLPGQSATPAEDALMDRMLDAAFATPGGVAVTGDVDTGTITVTPLRDGMSDHQAMEMVEAFDTRAGHAALMIERIEGMDATDVSMVCGKALQARVHEWGDVSHVSLSADPDSLAYVTREDGFDLTMTAGIEVVFKDQGVIELPVIVTADVDDGIFGFRDIEITDFPS